MQMALIRRHEGRPFVGKLLPHGLFAFDASCESEVGSAPFARVRGLLGDAATHRIDVEIGNVVRSSRPSRSQDQQ
jgi:hypothetical protein